MVLHFPPLSQISGILPAALQLERTFQGIVLITTEACPMETRSGFFVARRGASARKPPVQVGNGTAPRECSAGQGGRSHQNSLLGVIARSRTLATLAPAASAGEAIST